MNDYHAYKSTSGGSGGCGGRIWLWVLLIYGIIKLLGKL